MEWLPSKTFDDRLSLSKSSDRCRKMLYQRCKADNISKRVIIRHDHSHGISVIKYYLDFWTLTAKTYSRNVLQCAGPTPVKIGQV